MATLVTSPFYTTVQLVRDSVSHLGTATNISSAIVAEAIVWWESVIHVKLSPRYTIPVSLGDISAAVLENIATAGAAYYLLMRAPSAQSTDRGTWMDRFRERSVDLLDAIAAGSASLPVSGGAQSGLVIWSNTMNNVPTFAEGLRPEDSRWDPSKTLGELDRRRSG